MNIEQLTETLTNAGVEINENVKIEDIHKNVNDVFTGIIKNKVETAQTKALESVDGSKFVNEFISGLGYENVDQFNAFVNSTKANADEKDEAVKRITGEKEAIAKEKEELANKMQELNKGILNMKINNAFGFAGISKEKAEDFVPIVMNKITDDMNDEDITNEINSIISKYELKEDDSKPKIGGFGKPKTTGKDEPFSIKDMMRKNLK